MSRRWIYMIRAVIFACSAIVLFVIYRDKDKAELSDWFNSFDKNQVDAFFVATQTEAEAQLSSVQIDELVSILNDIEEDNLTENKHLAGITPEFAFRLVVGDTNYYISQADAPHGQTEITFNNKLWWIESIDLRDAVTAF